MNGSGHEQESIVEVTDVHTRFGAAVVNDNARARGVQAARDRRTDAPCCARDQRHLAVEARLHG